MGYGGQLLPKGTDRFCCYKAAGGAELVKNSRICIRKQKAAKEAKDAKDAKDALPVKWANRPRSNKIEAK